MSINKKPFFVLEVVTYKNPVIITIELRSYSKANSHVKYWPGHLDIVIFLLFAGITIDVRGDVGIAGTQADIVERPVFQSASGKDQFSVIIAVTHAHPPGAVVKQQIISQRVESTNEEIRDWHRIVFRCLAEVGAIIGRTFYFEVEVDDVGTDTYAEFCPVGTLEVVTEIGNIKVNIQAGINLAIQGYYQVIKFEDPVNSFIVGVVIIVEIVQTESPALTEPEGRAEKIGRLVFFQAKVVHVNFDFRLPILGGFEIPGHVVGYQTASQDDAFIPFCGGQLSRPAVQAED
jgi:hypothetical protein